MLEKLISEETGTITGNRVLPSDPNTTTSARHIVWGDRSYGDRVGGADVVARGAGRTERAAEQDHRAV